MCELIQFWSVDWYKLFIIRVNDFNLCHYFCHGLAQTQHMWRHNQPRCRMSPNKSRHSQSLHLLEVSFYLFLIIHFTLKVIFSNDHDTPTPFSEKQWQCPVDLLLVLFNLCYFELNKASKEEECCYYCLKSLA